MKAIVKEKEEEQEPIIFPCLMKGKQTGKIVLFMAPNKGTILTGGMYGKAIGTPMPCIESVLDYDKFKGTLELSND